MSNIRNLLVIITFTFLLTLYIKQNQEKANNYQYNANVVKNIVAYSLMKKIEMESQTRQCELPQRNFYNEAQQQNYKKWSKLDDTDFFIYSVHEDRRLEPYNYIRIIGMAKGKWNVTLFCNLITSDANLSSLGSSPASKTPIWSDNWLDEDDEDNYKPFLISCQLPVRRKPIKLYLNKNPCETTGEVPIHSTFHKRPTRTTKKIAVCVKPLDFQNDISKKLSEWIEINKILGVDYFDFYVKNVHENVLKTLKWYRRNDKRIKLILDNHESIDKFSQTPRILIRTRRKVTKLAQKRKNEILTYNDCFYNNLQRADYVIPLDIDEIIIPRKTSTLHQLLPDFPDNFASYSVRNTYYLLKDQINTGTFFLRTFKRTKFSDLGESGKSFVSTQNALTVFNHYALDVLKPGIGRCYFLPDNLVQMNHYRHECPLNLLPECVKYISSPRIFDDIILKYKKLFEKNFSKLRRHFSYF